MQVHPFRHSRDFENAFRQHLQDLLELPPDRDALGLFILVLANLGLLPDLAEAMAPALERRYRQLSDRLDELDQLAPADDRKVFEQLQGFDLNRPLLSRPRDAGPWQLQFNPLRSLRPARNSSAVIQSLFRPFDEQGFHFDKPFLDREILWRGEIGDTELRLLFNKFPFARYHCLALIEAAEHRPQYLSRPHLDQLLRVMDALSGLEGLCFAWNSLGAQASVNHQHWQMTLRDRAYPIEQAAWRHNGGNLDYPLEVQVFTDAGELWAAIDDCQQRNRAFNLFLRPGRYLLVPRRLQGSYPVPAWAGGLAWSEVCGNFTLGDEDAFKRLQAEDVESILGNLREGS